MAEPTLYLFDGYNLLHAGDFGDRSELIDLLASFVAANGARGVLVFDGVGEDRDIGPLAVRYADHADDVLERLAAEHRRSELVCVVSSDAAVVRTSGQEVRKVGSRQFLSGLASPEHTETEQRGAGGRIRDGLDPETREKLERLRRGG
jgi:predicted RNA-binding protein with PIN domain